MNRTEQKIIETIDAHAEELIAFARDIYSHPEKGFYENRTAGKVKEMFTQLGLELTDGLARTGVKGWLPTRTGDGIATETASRRLAVIGELDGIFCTQHPYADGSTGFSHACGHHAQLTTMLGAAMALSVPEVRAALDGEVCFFAVPAEEYPDARTRAQVTADGSVQFAGNGKSELIRIGAFDDVDIALSTHVHMVPAQEDFLLGNPTCNGCISKIITMHGQAAHAAAAPWDGVNALSAATAALNMIGLMRESFRDEEHVRVHSAIRKGGDALNVIPDCVVAEEMVRAKTLAAMEDAAQKVDRAFEGAAYAFGATAEIENMQGYLPIVAQLPEQAQRDAFAVLQETDQTLTVREVTPETHNNACTDLGDLSCLKPIVNFTHGWFSGALHSKEFTITDERRAYLLPAKLMALTVYQLLRDGGGEAEQICQCFHPTFTKEEYIHYIEAMTAPRN